MINHFFNSTYSSYIKGHPYIIVLCPPKLGQPPPLNSNPPKHLSSKKDKKENHYMTIISVSCCSNLAFNPKQVLLSPEAMSCHMPKNT